MPALFQYFQVSRHSQLNRHKMQWICSNQVCDTFCDTFRDCNESRPSSLLWISFSLNIAHAHKSSTAFPRAWGIWCPNLYKLNEFKIWIIQISLLALKFGRIKKNSVYTEQILILQNSDKFIGPEIQQD